MSHLDTSIIREGAARVVCVWSPCRVNSSRISFRNASTCWTSAQRISSRSASSCCWRLVGVVVMHQVVHIFAQDLVRREVQQGRTRLVGEGTVPLGIEAVNAFTN